MARLHDRGGRDAAGFGPYHRPDAELVPMRELTDWQLSRGEPDIRGWEVRTVSGRALGTVRELLVDRQSREVVLLDLDLTGGDRRARAPLRAVQIDREARVIRMDSADLLGGAAAADAVVADTVVADAPDASTPPTERVVDRPVATAADLGGRDRADLDRGVEPGRPTATDRADERITENDSRRAAEERLANGGIDETVVERRPVVYEEVVVRRTREATGRDVAPDADPRDIPRDDRR
jgi:hypothetical protein